MSLGKQGPEVPETNKGLMVAAGICLAIPVIALMWVSSYNKVDPKLGGVPFFFWYQFLWVILCSVLTYSAHLLVLAARKGGRRDVGKGTGETTDTRDDRDGGVA